MADKPTTDFTDVVPEPEKAADKTTVAVALKYDKEEDPAPRIVATGRGSVAEQILALAFANDVKVREDAELVEILSMLEIDSLIPLEAYAAVAEILSYVYRANQSAQHYQLAPNWWEK